MRVSSFICLLTFITYCQTLHAYDDVDFITGEIKALTPNKEITITRLSGSVVKYVLYDKTTITLNGKTAELGVSLIGMNAKLKVLRSKFVMSIEASTKDYLEQQKKEEEAKKNKRQVELTKKSEEERADLARWVRAGEIVSISRNNGAVVTGRVVGMSHLAIKVTDGRNVATFQGKDIKVIVANNDSYSWNEVKQSFESAKVQAEEARRLAQIERSRPLTKEERLEKAKSKILQVVIAHWYANTRKASINDILSGRGISESPTFGEHLFNALAIQIRNDRIEEAIVLLFPELDKIETSIIKKVVIMYLDDKASLESLSKDVVKTWFIEQLKKNATENTKQLITITNEVAEFMSNVHENVVRKK